MCLDSVELANQRQGMRVDASNQVLGFGFGFSVLDGASYLTKIRFNRSDTRYEKIDFETLSMPC